MLCSCLAWQREQSRLLQQASELTQTTSLLTSQEGPNQAARVPTIIYASRTHSQLSQVVRELRNTRYRPTHAVLGSREQMCVNPKVKKATSSATDINHDCSKLGKERRCRFRNNLEGFTAPPNEEGAIADTQPVMDMEDLVSMGKKSQVCPFYYTRSKVETAELVLVPYNYLFDKDARETTLAGIPWDNAVVIFDEAHNLESFASESASFDLSNHDVAGCVSEVQKAMNYAQAMPEQTANLKSENLIKLKAIFLQLEDFIMNLGSKGAFSGEYMMEIFQQGAGITHANHEIFIEEVRKVNDLIMDLRGTGAMRGSPRLEHFVQCIKRVYGHGLESRCLAKAACYRVHVTPTQSGTKNASRTVSYWCFAPALAMEELSNLNVRSIIVTSGTLAPLPSYGMELGLNFPHTLENPHIIADEQLHVRVVGKGVSGKNLTSSFERRKDGEYFVELGNTLVSIAKVVPDGMLVFFPSYGVMETCLERWGGPVTSRPKNSNSKGDFFAAKRKQNAASQYSFPLAPASYYDANSHSTPWKRMLSTKSVVTEPRSTLDLPDAMAEFKRFLAMPKSPGCILMGVCRGKISEGIDFANEMSRAVVITGLPFAPSMDPKVKLKREYLDRARTTGSVRASDDGGFNGSKSKPGVSNRLSGHEWYTQQAHRAVNQAIGRVIRNRSDYGAVILMDSRFSQERNQEGLSKWLRPHIQKDEGFGAAIRSLASFYKGAREKMKEMEKAEVEAAAKAVVLEYEDDDAAGDKITKVALIRTAAGLGKSEHSSATDEDTAENAYVAPGQVIARLDVGGFRQHSSSAGTDSGGNDKPAASANPKPARFDAVFDSKQGSASTKKPAATDSSADTKAVAAQFMKKTQQRLSVTEQSMVRKAIVAMKGYGDQNDARSYLKSALEVVRLAVLGESFEKIDGSGDQKMLLLFFFLLPRKFRANVEARAFKLVFDASTLGQMCKENLELEDLGAVRVRVAAILNALWCPVDRASELSAAKYLPKAKEILAVLDKTKTNKVASTTVFHAYIKLVPPRYTSATRALFDELRASKNINRMKRVEQSRVGENSVDAARFQVPAKVLASLSGQEKEAPNPVTADSLQAAKAHQLKRKRPEEAAKAPKPAINPYAKKPAVLATDDQSKAKAPPRQQKPSISSYLKSVESDTYVKRTGNDIASSIKTNVPKNMVCSICSDELKQPFIADCGHMACIKCWTGWLKRSETCPTCRKPATRDSLARAVFQNAFESNPPTLSQLCGPDDGLEDNADSDGELEIC